MNVSLVLLIIAGLWLLVLTLVIAFSLIFFRHLVKGAEGEDLKKVLDKILSVQKLNSSQISDLKKEIDRLEEENLVHIQKLGLVKFNPFSETGGDHSFSLALLDGKNNGMIITGLHTRERTRVYIKPVKNGKSGIELSGEERKALLSAQRG